MRFVTKFSLVATIVTTSVMLQGTGAANPPRADQIPHVLEQHGEIRIDPYYWLRDRDNPKVIAHIEAENRYTNSRLDLWKPYADELVKEFSSRVPKVKDGAAYEYKGYSYWTRTFSNKEYPIYLRSKDIKKSEEVLVDVNVLAQGHQYFDLDRFELAANDRLLAMSFDTIGRRQYTLKVLDRSTNQPLLVVEKMSGVFEWFGEDLYYTVQDPETLREYQVYRIRRVNPQSEFIPEYGKPELVFEEDDETYSVSIEKSITEETLFVHSSSTLADEWHFLSLSEPDQLKVVEPRTRGLEYQVKDGGQSFFILTNHEATDFQVMEVPKVTPGLAYWKSFLPPQSGYFREGLSVFKNYIVVYEKKNGQDVFRVMNRLTHDESNIAFPEEVSVANPFTNLNFDSNEFLYKFESLKTPPSVYKYNVHDKTIKKIHQDTVVGYDSNLYQTERIWVPSRDGTLIPTSLVYKKGLTLNGQNPALVYGYGSYGLTIEPTFNSKRISLLDRGFVFAIAHVRGGAMLGRNWYEQGKLLHKKNTFTDFIDVSRYLVSQHWTSPRHLYAQGGSAGGLLMGVIINEEPKLYHGVIAEVPFVDVVTTMLDESIPLTTSEYDEWGDPRDRIYYDYMLSYSPYDNIKSQSYPNLLVTSGLHDSQVQYWEPTKWVAKLRDLNVGQSLILLKTNMQAGHGGSSGQIQGFLEVAEEWSFILGLQFGQMNRN